MKSENKNINLKDLRKRYASSNNKFCMKIRENKNDIIYYNGIKAFEIQHTDEKNYNIVMPENIYNFNRSNIKKIDNILESVIKLRQDMSTYFVNSITSVKIAVSYAQYEKLGQNVNNELEKILNTIKEEINGKYDNYIKLNNIGNIKNYFINGYSKYKKSKIEIQKQFQEGTDEFKDRMKNLKKHDITYKIEINSPKENMNDIDKYIEDITNIEYIFIKNFLFGKNMQYLHLFKIPEFTYKRERFNK